MARKDKKKSHGAGSRVLVVIAAIVAIGMVFATTSRAFTKLESKVENLEEKLERNNALLEYLSKTEENHYRWMGAQLYGLCEHLGGSWDQQNLGCTLTAVGEDQR